MLAMQQHDISNYSLRYRAPGGHALNDSQFASKDMHTAVMCMSAMQQHDHLVVKS